MTGSSEGGRAWRTRRGDTLCRRAVSLAADGVPVLLRAQRLGAWPALRSMAADEFGLEPLHLSPQGGASPVEALAALADLRGGNTAMDNLVELIAGPALSDAIVIATIDGVDPRPWLTFAGLFATARAVHGGRAAGLVLVHATDYQPSKGCRALNDDEIVDSLDALLLVRDETAWSSSLIAHAAAAALVEACRGDLDQLALLTSLRPEDAFQPFPTFARTPPLTGPAPLCWRGRSEPCPFWLAHNQPERLRHRIWRGQLSIIFPWLEETRARYLEKAGSRLPLIARDPVTDDQIDVASYEFAHIATALRHLGYDRKRGEAAHLLRLARNELAHCRALSVPDLRRTEAAALLLLG